MPDYDGTNVCRSSQSIRPPTTKVITTAIRGSVHYKMSDFCLVSIFKMNNEKKMYLLLSSLRNLHNITRIIIPIGITDNAKIVPITLCP